MLKTRVAILLNQAVLFGDFQEQAEKSRAIAASAGNGEWKDITFILCSQRMM